MDHFSLQAGRTIAATVDDFYRGLFTGGTVAAAQKTAVASPSDKSLEKLEVFIESINNVTKKLDAANWPRDGRFMVHGPLVGEWFRSYLIKSKVIGTGEATDTALVQAQIGSLFGMTTVQDNNLADPSAANANYCLIGYRDAVLVAQQIRSVIPYRPEKRFGDAVKGLFVYGGLLHQDDHRHFVQQAA